MEPVAAGRAGFPASRHETKGIVAMPKSYLLGACLAACLAAAGHAALAADQPHNVVLFVADGLRARMVDDQTAPGDGGAGARGRDAAQRPLAVPDLHHRQCLGDGDRPLSRRHRRLQQHDLYRLPGAGAGNSLTPFLESDPVLGDVDEHFAGNYLNEDTILKLAREKGFGTAAIGKLGPALIFDHTRATGRRRSSSTMRPARPSGIPLSPEVTARLTAAGLPLRDARPRREWQGRRCDDARHH